MFVRAASMNWRSVAEQVWTRFGFARPFVTSASATVTMTSRPAAERPSRRTPIPSAACCCSVPPHSGAFSRAQTKTRLRYEIVWRMPIVLVDADRRRVLGAHEQADGRHPLEQQAAEVAHASLGVAAAARRAGRPRPAAAAPPRASTPDASALNRITSVLDPEPRAAVLDLHARPPAEALRVARRAGRSRAPRDAPRRRPGRAASKSSCVAERSAVSPGSGGSSST